jgi:hypothetical protein
MNKVTGGERTRAPKTANPPSNKVPKEARGFEKRFGKLLPETPAEQEANGRGEGDQPAQGGSVSGSMHRAWTSIKSTITGMNEHPVLAECERGEDTPAPNGKGIVEDYENLSHTPPDMGLLYEYLKTLGVSESRLPEMAADMHAHALKLVKAEVAGRAAPVAAPAPFAEALEAMTLKDRRAALAKHYAARKKNTWTKARGGDKATPEKFLAWLDAVFPDRSEVGMVFSDLKYLDEPAYKKVINWSRPDSGVAKTAIESFGLPTKTTKYDPVRDTNPAALLAEVPSHPAQISKTLHRAGARALYHAGRN